MNRTVTSHRGGKITYSFDDGWEVTLNEEAFFEFGEIFLSRFPEFKGLGAFTIGQREILAEREILEKMAKSS